MKYGSIQGGIMLFDLFEKIIKKLKVDYLYLNGIYLYYCMKLISVEENFSALVMD